MEKPNVTRPYKGLHNDSSKKDQTKDTYTFALNTINETELGDTNFLSNEESNEVCGVLTDGFIPIGKVYINNNETVIFSVSSTIGKGNTISEIGILDDDCTYTPYVNDSNSKNEDKLNFSINNQIQAIYRLRRGCEKTIYFTDNLNKPKYFNFNKLGLFKNKDGTWNTDLFNLQKSYKKVPIFNKVEVLDEGGNIEAGSYNFSIQYLDSNLNPTEWITSTPTVKIYNDKTTGEFSKINGSINTEGYLDFPASSKSIELFITNLDSDYLFYRIAIIASNNGTGIVNQIEYSSTIDIKTETYIYTGVNAEQKGTEEEVLIFQDIIYKTKSIEQIENRLLFANTEGKQVNLCKFQQYASKIRTDLVLKNVVLTDIKDPSNPKNPTHEFGGKGYMPGEIYSFGIVYLFNDGTTSSAYHIPGKSPNVDAKTIFSPGDNVLPMSNDNVGTSTYTDNTICVNGDNYWGRDSENEILEGKKIRHHRFPLRNEVSQPLVKTYNGNEYVSNYYSVNLYLTGKLIKPSEEETGNIFYIRIRYEIFGEEFYVVEEVNTIEYENNFSTNSEGVSYVDANINIVSNYLYNNKISDIINITVQATDEDNEYQNQSQLNNYFVDPPTINTEIKTYNSTFKERVFTTNIFGIKFSNVDLPTTTGDNKVIGYYIVRNERTEVDKTILDTGVLTQSVVNKKYIGNGLLTPNTNKISSTVYGIIHPEHQFNNIEYKGYDEIIQQGYFDIVDTKYGMTMRQDVFEGTGFKKGFKAGNTDGSKHKFDPKEPDGFSLAIISRDSIVEYKNKSSNFKIPSNKINNSFYLEGLGNQLLKSEDKQVWNMAPDNKTGIIQFKEDSIGINDDGKILPSVILKRNNIDSYSNFRTLPYYKESLNYFEFNKDSPNDDVSTVFGGDVVVSPMRYANSIHWNTTVAFRKEKTSVLDSPLLAGLLAVASIVLIPFTGGASVLVTSILISSSVILGGAAILVYSNGIKYKNFIEAFEKEYKKGLRKTGLDAWVGYFYKIPEGEGGEEGDRQNFLVQIIIGIIRGIGLLSGYNNRGNWKFGYLKPDGGTSGETGLDGFADDTIQWIGDCVTDLWFESTVNCNLRNGFSKGNVPTYLDSPGKIESGNDVPQRTWEFHGKDFILDINRKPVSSLEVNLESKLLAFDENKNQGRSYIGVALPDYCNVNKDYTRSNKQKIYYHLPLEYDCCSPCNEIFPHRIVYSEQSFQEELSDNYKILLPNNYRDIQGETGEITNIFHMNNNLFIHTREGLWKMPRSYQERVTDQIISFIGTGSYFEIPPQKVLDDETGFSAGLQHKWSAIKTPHGYFFVCESERKIYQFNGNQLKPISSLGLSNWFKENIELSLDKTYYNSIGKQYPYQDNPSNVFGTGFLTTYDSSKERIIFTKKDSTLKEDVIEREDTEICIENSVVTLFYNFNENIKIEVLDDWKYKGIEDCKLKFEKEIYTAGTENRRIYTGVIVSEYCSYDILGIIIRIPCKFEASYTNSVVPVTTKSITTKFIKGVVKEDILDIDNSWTISYSLKNNSWTSWHSYLPNFYISTPEKFYSWVYGNNSIWKHNIKGDYQRFYCKLFPHIIEYVSLSNPISTRVWDSITLITEAKEFKTLTKEYVDKRHITFNKAIVYNSRQCSGLLILKVKDSSRLSYLEEQVVNNSDTLIDRNERNWSFNDFRDIRTNYNDSIWVSNKDSFKNEYYIDKILNTSTMDRDKDWTQLEDFRDKYLVIRLIFDNFGDIKLITNYSVESETFSSR